MGAIPTGWAAREDLDAQRPPVAADELLDDPAPLGERQRVRARLLRASARGTPRRSACRGGLVVARPEPRRHRPVDLHDAAVGVEQPERRARSCSTAASQTHLALGRARRASLLGAVPAPSRPAGPTRCTCRRTRAMRAGARHDPDDAPVLAAVRRAGRAPRVAPVARAARSSGSCGRGTAMQIVDAHLRRARRALAVLPERRVVRRDEGRRPSSTTMTGHAPARRTAPSARRSSLRAATSPPPSPAASVAQSAAAGNSCPERHAGRSRSSAHTSRAEPYRNCSRRRSIFATRCPSGVPMASARRRGTPVGHAAHELRVRGVVRHGALAREHPVEEKPDLVDVPLLARVAGRDDLGRHDGVVDDVRADGRHAAQLGR